MKKIVFVALLSGVFLSSALADDFLAKVSNGALSDNSAGVRELTMEEAKQVVGGYYVIKGPINATEYAVIAVPDSTTTYSQRVQINNVTIGDEDQLLTYIVKKNIGYNRQGKSFIYFSYSTAVYYKPTKSFIKHSSTLFLNHNGVIQELARNYKSYAENYLKTH